jgi:L-asparaginase II
VQVSVRHMLEDLTGTSHTQDVAGIDGCSIPTYAMPLPALAFAFAKFGSGHGISRECQSAAERIRKAVAKHPFMVAGTGRFDTVLMEALGERAFVKVGAEGVYCAALPERGLGIALKVDDGATRAAEVAIANLILHFLPLKNGQLAAVQALTRPVLKNWNGIEVGALQATDVLTGL